MATEHGGAMVSGGKAETALPVLDRRRKCGHNLKEGEAELRAHACWSRWRSHGELRRRVRGRGEGQSLGLSALEEREGSAGGSERAHWLRQLKASTWAQAQVVAAARRATPTLGRHAARAS